MINISSKDNAFTVLWFCHACELQFIGDDLEEIECPFCKGVCPSNACRR